MPIPVPTPDPAPEQTGMEMKVKRYEDYLHELSKNSRTSADPEDFPITSIRSGEFESNETTQSEYDDIKLFDGLNSSELGDMIPEVTHKIQRRI